MSTTITIFSIKDIIFNIFILNRFSERMILYNDYLLPADIINIIINYQLIDFVNVKDIDRDILFEELWTWAQYIKPELNPQKYRFNILDKKDIRKLCFNNGYELFGVPLSIDIYCKEDFINKSRFDKFYGEGICQKIINIVNQGKRPNTRNYKRIAHIKNDIKHPEHPELSLMLIDPYCFPLKKGQEIVLVSREFYDKKFRVVAKAKMMENIDDENGHEMVIIKMKQTFSLEFELYSFVVLPLSDIAIHKKDYEKNKMIYKVL